MQRVLYSLFLCWICLVATAQNDYDTQRGIELYNQKNYTAAIPYFQKAAKAGSLPALDFLGYMYECGLGTGKDFSIAINLYKKGVEKNYAPCLLNMGRLYENGSGVEKNPVKAFSYYKKELFGIIRFSLFCLLFDDILSLFLRYTNFKRKIL